MSEITKNHPTAQKPSGITPATAAPPQPTPQTLQPTPTRTAPPSATPGTSAFLQPTPVTDPGTLRKPRSEDLDADRSVSPTPALPQPGAIPFLPKETGTGPSSRCSSVNPNDTLPPTPTSGPEAQPPPYPPQMRIPPMSLTRDIGKSTSAQPPEMRPTTHLPLDNTHEKGDRASTTTASVLLPMRTDNYNGLPSQPAPGAQASYSAARSSTEIHPSGYRQNTSAIDRPVYYEQELRGEEEETLLGKLGKWVEGINSKIVDSAIAGDTKEKGKE